MISFVLITKSNLNFDIEIINNRSFIALKHVLQSEICMLKIRCSNITAANH